MQKFMHPLSRLVGGLVVALALIGPALAQPPAGKAAQAPTSAPAPVDDAIKQGLGL